KGRTPEDFTRRFEPSSFGPQHFARRNTHGTPPQLRSLPEGQEQMPVPCHCADGWICEAHPHKPWPHDECPRLGELVAIRSASSGGGSEPNWTFFGTQALGGPN